MKLRYRVTREKAIDFGAYISRPDLVANNADVIAQWLQDLRQQRVEIARLGGQATAGISTPAKQRASRENGKLGGRPARDRS